MMRDFETTFEQYYLHKISNLNLTKTSSYSKVQAYTEGAIKRYKKNLYKSQKYFILDLQTIMDFDADSAMVVFKDHNDLIRFQELKQSQVFDMQQGEELNKSFLSQSYKPTARKTGNPFKKQVLVQCSRCGKYTPVFKFCPDCEDTHYCSETCEVNFKISHLKIECSKNIYPKYFNPVLIQVHFGSDLGHNLEVYFQHQSRMSALVRGKNIINQLLEHFQNQKQSNMKISKLDEGTLNSSQRKSPSKNTANGRLSEYMLGYNLVLHSQQNKQSAASSSNLVKLHYLQIKAKNQKEHESLSKNFNIQIQSIEDIQRIYASNPILQEIELYLLKLGGLMYQKIEEVHNNHIHFIYVFRMF